MKPSACSNPSMRLVGIGHSFGRGASGTVLKNVSIELSPGKTVGVCGHNGCGKSTLLRIAAGVEKPTVGSVELIGGGGLDAMGYVPQAPVHAIMPWFSVRKNVSICAKAHDVGGPAVEGILEEFGFAGEYARKYPLMLSGGFQQRLAWAMAMCGLRRILVLDEPFASQDARWTKNLLTSLQARTRSGAAALVCSHDLELLVLCCDSIVVLRGDEGGATIADVVAVDLASRELADISGDSVHRYVSQIDRVLYGA